MGHQPIPPAPHRRPPDRESFYLGIAKSAYVSGGLTLGELEASIEHVLFGGRLNASGRVPAAGELPSLPDPDLVMYVHLI